MKKYEKIFTTSFLFSILIIMAVLIIENPAHGDNHYLTELAIVRIDEKIKAQNFILKRVDGTEVNLEDYRGKVLLLNFWATWCLPCRVEMPSMEKLYQEYKNKGFSILAIDMQEDANTVRAFKEQYKLNFPILLDSDGSVGQFYGVRSIPATYLVNRQGYLIGSALGARDWATESAFMLINSLLKESPNS